MRTLYTQVDAIEALPYAVRTANAAVNGTVIDTARGGNNYREVLFIVKTETVTDGTVAITVEESAQSGSGFAAAARVVGSLPTVTADDDNAVFLVSVLPTLRYVRLVATTAGATSGAGISAVAVLGNGNSAPHS
ncbi:uncharacterized protein RMCC_2434 [Mycolicibacterium canariasense]|uniref:Uncharacterized protein n=1 Tax=Mycolicibacterium canariasense TaxID=228230 RepID=A0A100WCD9_MYCCR|nr:hypothetical protein [Mycolicibacterium canariasense]MCV7212659.1 hypothetical protein [Mycolicibacterium canariasense]ORV02506.1 hypothetical protein AWB94_00775 [Mycolicibacterium canariasense]GAS95468.1 uncharacterized protein RMCC_2434 [Mycolicibacterium canariasense]